MRSRQWDIFCKVVDNFGDIGICWRLAADLAARGQRVRLWVDDASALTWMAPSVCDGLKTDLEVLAWTESIDVSCLDTAPCDVLVEAFGCDIAPDFIAACARIHWNKDQTNATKPLWINLEYLSAEPYVERNHGLTSLVNSGPAAGWYKVFYYPGFTPKTGGLLREPDLAIRQADFDRTGWLNQHGIEWQGETLLSLFCYEPPALAQLLADLELNGMNGQPVRLLVAAGRATEAVKAIKTSRTPKNARQISPQANEYRGKQLLISYLPLLTQTDFDHLLWTCDINFVRGEDSIVRAIWAGKPFVWQIYPQDDGAQGPKLEAFLDLLAAKPSLQGFHRVWNGLAMDALPPLASLDGWRQTAADIRSRLTQQRDLTTGLLEFVLKTR